MAQHTETELVDGVFVGIEVGKATLAVAVGPTGETRTVTNDATGWAQRTTWLSAQPVQRLVLAATGGDHAGGWLALGEAELPVAVVNPGWTQALARSEGRRAKTDRSDAQQQQPAVTPIPADVGRQLAALIGVREHLVKQLVMTQNRQHTAAAIVRPLQEELIASLTAQRERGTAEIAALGASDPELQAQVAQLQTGPGIGPVVRATLVARAWRWPPGCLQGAVPDGAAHDPLGADDPCPGSAFDGARSPPAQGGGDRLCPAAAGDPDGDGAGWAHLATNPGWSGRLFVHISLTANTVTTGWGLHTPYPDSV